MDLHMHNQEISVGICLLLGALHALEPGHGKTAFAAHLVTEKKNYFRPLVLAFTTAITHAMSILLISIIVHGLIHSAFAVESVVIYRWLNLLSGLFLLGIGILILRGSKKIVLEPVQAKPSLHVHRGGCCGEKTEPNVAKTWRTVAIGFVVGLIPCPSALVALSAALTSGDASSAVLIVSMFSLGIFLSLTVVGSVFVRASSSFHKMSLTKSRPRIGSQIQFAVFAATGLWHISMF